MKIIIEYIKDVLLLLIIAFIITYSWQWLEIKMYGYVTYRKVDNIVASILMISIYMNINSYGTLRRIKKVIDKYK